MTFQKGISGNPLGRPRRRLSQAGTVKQAWDELIKEKPDLVKDAFERGIEGKRALGFLELGAKLGGEIGNQGEGNQSITIVFASPLDSGKLRAGTPSIHVVEAKALPPASEDAELLETLALEAVPVGD